MEEYLQTIGKAIARQRKKVGLTQVQVAERLKLDKGTLSRIENGGITVTVDKLYQLSHLFNCRIVDFLWFKEHDRLKRVVEVLDIVNSVPEPRRDDMLEFLELAAGKAASRC